MRFQLDVVQGRGVPRSISVEEVSLSAAIEHAQRQGFTVLGARGAEGGLRARLSAGLRRGDTGFDVAVFVEQLRDLLAAGLSVIEALQALHGGAGAGKRQAVEALMSRLRGGERLSAAMAADPRFPALLVALVQAAELTADLPKALSRYAEHAQRVRDLRDKVLSVAIYPLLLVAVGGGVLMFLLLHVVPRFARVFEGLHGELPWSARAMVAWSHFLGGWGSAVLAALAALLVGAGVAAASPAGRRWWLAQLAALPVLRGRLRVYFLSRWYRATGMLVEGGIPLPEALRLCGVLLPGELQDAGQRVEAALQQGRSPADAYTAAGMTTPVAEQLLRAGERTGDLGAVLSRLAQFHETEVTRALEQGMKALEPVVMVLIGIGVGTVVVLMYLPIFELASAIQ